MNFKFKTFLASTLIALLSFASASADVGDATPIGSPAKVSPPTAALKNSADKTLTDITVTWTLLTDAQTSGSAIIGYQAVPYANPYSSAGLTSCSAGPTTNTCTVSGLAFNTNYKFKVIATNSNGSSTSEFSNIVLTPSQTQSITVTGAPTSYHYGDPDFQLTGTATSGLPVSWSSNTPSICTVDASGVVHFLASGTCVIKTSQSGAGSSYGPATDVLTTVTSSITASISINSATNVQGNSATLNANVPYPGENVTPTFCLSLTNSISDTCVLPSGVTIGSSMPSPVTAISSNAVSASASGLSSGTTYYFWAKGTTSTTSATSSTSSFTTASGPSLALTGTPTGVVGTAMTLTFTATGGSGDYVSWDHGTLPDGLVFSPSISTSTISGTPTTVASTPTWVSVTDSGGLTATYSVTIAITSASTGGGSGGSGGINPTPSSGKKDQVINNSEIPEPATLKPGKLNLNGSASSGLPVAYLSNTPSVCTVDANGQVIYLTPGECSITISQVGNSEYSPVSKTLIIKIAAKLAIVLEEFANVQSNSVTTFATSEWPGVDADIKFCVSLTNSTSDCNLPNGVKISEIKPEKLTSDSGSSFTADISGLLPMTNYYVWAEEITTDSKAVSEIRKLHTPQGPAISYVGKTEYKINESAKIIFHATGGAGGYKNWLVQGLPVSMESSGSGITINTSGYFTKPGIYVAAVSVMDKNGISASINLPITVIDENGNSVFAPTNVYTQLISATQTKVIWQSVPGAVNYVVTLKGIKVGETPSNNLILNGLFGPKSTVTVSAINSAGKQSMPVIAIYKAPVKPIQIAIANFDLNSAILKLTDKVKIQKLAKVISAEGLTSLQVSGFTDAQGTAAINTPLSNARAKNTYSYLQGILNKTALSVSLAGNGAKNPVASNATKEGQAANRRAVIDLK